MARYVIGYMTMTADVLHAGHLYIIQCAASQCTSLIIGLTVDQVAAQQKRVPIHDFSHRKLMLESIKWVGSVVAHNGESKEEAWTKLKFDVLFMGDDHRFNPEYTNFQKNMPFVRVVCIPRLPGLSSSRHIAAFEERVFRTERVLALGIHGPILVRDRDRGQTEVIKPIHIGYLESEAVCGSDVYGISDPLPRNWKHEKPDAGALSWPMISGVNSWREIIVCEQLIAAGKSWCPFVSSRCVFRGQGARGNANDTNVDRVVHERTYPQEVHWLSMRYCGESLGSLLAKELVVDRSWVDDKVRTIVNEMKELGVVHGDIHAGNVCVDLKTREVSIIDYGWALSSECCLGTKEQDYLESCLKSDFDWRHYVGSLQHRATQY